MRRKCRKLKRGPGPKSPRWSAERRASPRHGGAGAFAKAPRRARLWHVAGARHAPERLSALRHPSFGVELEVSNPGANASRERERWLCGMRCLTSLEEAILAEQTQRPRKWGVRFGRTNPTGKSAAITERPAGTCEPGAAPVILSSDVWKTCHDHLHLFGRPAGGVSRSAGRQIPPRLRRWRAARPRSPSRPRSLGRLEDARRLARALAGAQPAAARSRRHPGVRGKSRRDGAGGLGLSGRGHRPDGGELRRRRRRHQSARAARRARACGSFRFRSSSRPPTSRTRRPWTRPRSWRRWRPATTRFRPRADLVCLGEMGIGNTTAAAAIAAALFGGGGGALGRPRHRRRRSRSRAQAGGHRSGARPPRRRARRSAEDRGGAWADASLRRSSGRRLAARQRAHSGAARRLRLHGGGGAAGKAARRCARPRAWPATSRPRPGHRHAARRTWACAAARSRHAARREPRARRSPCWCCARRSPATPAWRPSPRPGCRTSRSRTICRRPSRARDGSIFRCDGMKERAGDVAAPPAGRSRADVPGRRPDRRSGSSFPLRDERRIVELVAAHGRCRPTRAGCRRAAAPRDSRGAACAWRSSSHGRAARSWRGGRRRRPRALRRAPCSRRTRRGPARVAANCASPARKRSARRERRRREAPDSRPGSQQQSQLVRRRLVGERREAHDLGPGPPPAVEDVRIDEREGGVGGERDALAGRRQRRGAGARPATSAAPRRRSPRRGRDGAPP